MEDIMDTPRYLTLPEAARLMRCSKSKLRQMKDGPPRFRAPKSRVWLYPYDELIAWIESGRSVEPPQPKPVGRATSRTKHRNPLYELEK